VYAVNHYGRYSFLRLSPRAAKVSCIEFFAGLSWIDGTPLLGVIEPYRRRIFEAVLDTEHNNLALTGRAKKNWKSADVVLAGLFCLVVGTLDLIQRDGDGGIVVVDLKTSARKYSDLQVDASLQLSVYSYATAMNGLADQEDLRLRFDVLTKTKQPELHRYWRQRDRAASLGLFHLVAEVLYAIEAGVFHPNLGWQCKECQFPSRCWAWR
jgi:Holliday junction resolvase-like predicted endonuclease